jgi:hypothetical protein
MQSRSVVGVCLLLSGIGAFFLLRFILGYKKGVVIDLRLPYTFACIALD